MRPISFTAEDRRALAHDLYHYPDPHVQRKMEVLWLKSHCLGPDAIAASADVSRRTVQRDLDESLEGGLSRLRRCRWHQPHSALAEHQDSLEEDFLEHLPRSAQRARARPGRRLEAVGDARELYLRRAAVDHPRREAVPGTLQLLHSAMHENCTCAGQRWTTRGAKLCRGRFSSFSARAHPIPGHRSRPDRTLNLEHTGQALRGRVFIRRRAVGRDRQRRREQQQQVRGLLEGQCASRLLRTST